MRKEVRKVWFGFGWGRPLLSERSSFLLLLLTTTTFPSSSSHLSSVQKPLTSSSTFDPLFFRLSVSVSSPKIKLVLNRRGKVEIVLETQEMMDHCAIPQRALSAVCEEMSSMETVVCPKPIRVGVLHSLVADPIRTLRWSLSHQAEVSESAAGADLLDILLKGGSHDLEPFCKRVDSSPPFFNGSPPSRVSNPLILDARFREEKQASPISQPQLSITGPSSPSSYARKRGYSRPNFGNNPVVRIEGFTCMNRDGRNSAVLARA